jgi:hypothetical protein
MAVGFTRWGSPAWDHLINRESSGIPDIIQQIHDVNSGGNEAEGLFQITPKTWQRHNGTDFAPSARRAARRSSRRSSRPAFSPATPPVRIGALVGRAVHSS